MNLNQVIETTAEQTAFQSVASRLERIRTEMSSANNDADAAKMQQLIDKTRAGEVNIAFCGHFSAGKSTMINTLLGKALLPSNPIPTSANVVKIRGGEPAARVYTRNSGVLTFDPNTEMDALKKYAVDGDTVEWVEIAYPGTFLNEQASLLDTPGIDSTDAAHKIATESALHLADAVIYMMDYNHVQAEENFAFTKMLKDRGKPVYLVINMIDKHLDFELDFDSYKESVEDAFATWNIHPDGIYYTSLAEPDHPENQFEAFADKLKQLIAEPAALILQSVTDSAAHLTWDHQRFIRQGQSEQRDRLEAGLDVELDGVDARDRDQVVRALQAAEDKLADATGQVNAAREQFDKELTALLDNARLTYYTTNEAAERYLESRKPGFKVGLLFAGKKTEEEKAAREAALLADFRDKVETNLAFHFKELLTRIPQVYGIRDDAYHETVHALSIPITPEFLAAQIKGGAETREYVLNYCQDISKAIKSEYRRKGLELFEQVSRKLEERVQAEVNSLHTTVEALRAVAETHAALAALEQAERETGDRLRAILTKGE